MNKLVILFSLIALTVAMVPINRIPRAVPDDPDSNKTAATGATVATAAATAAPEATTATETAPTTAEPEHAEICARQTPCAWSVYNPITRIIEANMTNNYCICATGQSCHKTDDDSTINAYVYRCRTDEEVADLVWDT